MLCNAYDHRRPFVVRTSKGLVLGKVKVTGIPASAERRMGSTLKKLTKNAVDAKTHVRVVSDQRPKLGGRSGKGAAGTPSSSAAAARMGKSPRVVGGGGAIRDAAEATSGASSRPGVLKKTPPKAGRLSAVSNHGGGGRSPAAPSRGGGSTIRAAVKMQSKKQHIQSKKQLEESIKSYQDGSREQKERKTEIEAITQPFAKLGEELKAAGADKGKIEEVEKRIMELYGTKVDHDSRENTFKRLKEEYSSKFNKLRTLKQSIDNYMKKYGGHRLA